MDVDKDTLYDINPEFRRIYVVQLIHFWARFSNQNILT